MKYALNIAEDGRILSVTSEKYAGIGMALIEALPEGDIIDYIYRDGEYIYDPLPKPPPEPTPGERIAALEAALAALLRGDTE